MEYKGSNLEIIKNAESCDLIIGRLFDELKEKKIIAYNEDLIQSVAALMSARAQYEGVVRQYADDYED